MCVTYTLHELCASSITLPKCLLNVDVETKMPHIYEHWSNSTSTDSIKHTIQFSLMIEKLKIRTESIYRTVYPTLSSIQAPSNKIHFYRIRMKEIMDDWKMVEREREKKNGSERSRSRNKSICLLKCASNGYRILYLKKNKQQQKNLTFPPKLFPRKSFVR